MRDIEKDKTYLQQLRQAGYRNPLQEYAEYWIAQYEAAQARISELEEQLHVNNRKGDVDMKTSRDVLRGWGFEEQVLEPMTEEECKDLVESIQLYGE